MKNWFVDHHPAISLYAFDFPAYPIPLITCIIFLTTKLSPRLQHVILQATATKLTIRVGALLVQCTTTLHLILVTQLDPLARRNLYITNFLTLVLGETFLRSSDVSQYAYIAVGWLCVCIAHEEDAAWGLNSIPRLKVNATAGLLLSLVSVWQLVGRSGIQARISGLLLLREAAGSLLPLRTRGLRGDPEIFSRLTYAIIAIVAVLPYLFTRSMRPWTTANSGARLQQRLRYAQYHIANLSTYVVFFELFISGPLASAFFFSCFRFRWLFSRSPTSPPGWNLYSLFAGYFLAMPGGLIYLTPRNRQPPLERGWLFRTGRALALCWNMMGWSSVMLVAFWAILEVDAWRLGKLKS